MADNGNKRYYWLKLSEDFFRQKEIKKLRRIAGGDTYTVIYLKMLLRSMEDGGKLYYEGYESDFASELALDIDEDVENVKMTVAFLIANGILHENTISEYEITTAKEMVGSEGGSAKRMRKMRAVKAIAESEKRMLSQSDGGVTARDTDIDKEIEIDTDTDIDIRNPSDSCAEPEKPASTPQEQTVFTLPLNDGTEHRVTQADFNKYESLYPAVDVMQELRKMAGWLDGNPKNRKTKNGIRRFINSWLARAQDQGNAKKRKGSGGSGPGFDRTTSDNYVPLGVNDRLI